MNDHEVFPCARRAQGKADHEVSLCARRAQGGADHEIFPLRPGGAGENVKENEYGT